MPPEISHRFLHVVFDWNGTLLDDFPLAVRSVNFVRAKYALEPIDAERYRLEFGFPIRSFYERLGFDFSAVPFEDVMRDYLSVFDPGISQCPLHEGALELLDRLDAMGIPASILTASHQVTLDVTLQHFALERRFVNRIGLPDSNAHSKLELADDLQARLGVARDRVLYVGDTTHDADVARAMGWACIAIPRGHQPRTTLAASGVELADALDAIGRFVGA